MSPGRKRSWARSPVRRRDSSARHSDVILRFYTEAKPLIDCALAIALYLRHPIYDCLYLACAERAGTRLVTADWKFLAALAGTSLASLAVHMDAFTDG